MARRRYDSGVFHGLNGLPKTARARFHLCIGPLAGYLASRAAPCLGMSWLMRRYGCEVTRTSDARRTDRRSNLKIVEQFGAVRCSGLGPQGATVTVISSSVASAPSSAR